MKCWGQKDKHHVLGQVYSWRSTRPSLYLPIFKSLAFTIFYHYLLSYTIRIFLITNHQPLFYIPVESTPFFISSTSFCSMSSWFTSSCTYHLTSACFHSHYPFPPLSFWFHLQCIQFKISRPRSKIGLVQLTFLFSRLCWTMLTIPRQLFSPCLSYRIVITWTNYCWSDIA